MAGRDFFLFIDGTGCDRKHRSNVLRLCEALESYQKRDKTIVPIYIRGVNQHTSMPTIEGVFASSFKRQIVDAWDRLSDLKLNKDDRIHILGYSRGAVAAMILAQVLTDKKTCIEFIGEENLSGILSARVEFLGLFDPVVGYIHKFRSLFSDLEYKPSVSPSVLAYAELLSLDERRPHFPARTAINTFKAFMQKHDRSPEALPLRIAPRNAVSDGKDEIGFIRQRSELSRLPRYFVLMPGVHSEIGGNGGDKTLKDASLLTMVKLLCASSQKIAKLGLATLFFSPMSADITQVRIGNGSAFKEKLLNLRRRRFAECDFFLVSSLADDLTGLKGVNSHIFFPALQEYELPKYIRKYRRLKYP